MRYRKLKGGDLNPAYVCTWKTQKTGIGKNCVYVQGTPLHAAVSKRILEVMIPAQLEIAQKAQEELERREMDLNQQWILKIKRATYEVQLAQKRYEDVDSANRLVAATLEKNWLVSLGRV